MAQHYGIGIDLGATNIKMVAVTEAGAVLHEIREPTRDKIGLGQPSVPIWAETVKRLAANLEERNGAAHWLGIAAPGLASPDNRTIALMPGRLAGLEGLDWSRFLARTRTVPVLNDAHAALVGEHWLGAAHGYQDVILLTLGTGVGGAILIQGSLVQGRCGRTGHIGHITLDPDGSQDIVGMPGSLEAAVGECGLSQRSQGRYANAHQLLEDVKRGDAVASSIWLKSVQDLAAAVASLINILDPEAVIIGGGVARAGEVLFEPLNRFLDKYEWRPSGVRVKLLPATLGDFSGALGAARFAMQMEEE
ncbi:MAG TPA: ROK family protein [Acidobacteriota bacterium]|jgi:glucokinase